MHYGAIGLKYASAWFQRSNDQEVNIPLQRMLSFFLFIAVVLIFSACAPVKIEPVHIKCPACAYEFDVQPQKQK